MSLFNRHIEEIETLISGYPKTEFSYDENKTWETTRFPQFIMQKDSLVELGGGSLDAVGVTVTTSTFPLKNGIMLVGKDLKDLKGERPYARITLIKTKGNAGNEQATYDGIKDLDRVRYDVNVVGFMARASSLSLREEVRASKNDVKKGLSFERVGNALINEYLKVKNVEAVKIIFVTEEKVDFNALHRTAKTVVDAQNALNHLFDNIVLDCKSCTLKPICDEVEGMRESHFNAFKK